MGALLFIIMFCCACASKQSWFYSAMQPLLFVRIHAAKKGFDSPWFAPMDTYVTLRHRMLSQNILMNQIVATTFAVWKCVFSAVAVIRRCTDLTITFRRNTCGNFVNKRSRRVVFRVARNFSGHPKPRRSLPERRHLPPKSEPQGETTKKAMDEQEYFTGSVSLTLFGSRKSAKRMFGLVCSRSRRR